MRCHVPRCHLAMGTVSVALLTSMYTVILFSILTNSGLRFNSIEFRLVVTGHLTSVLGS